MERSGEKRKRVEEPGTIVAGKQKKKRSSGDAVEVTSAPSSSVSATKPLAPSEHKMTPSGARAGSTAGKHRRDAKPSPAKSASKEYISDKSSRKTTAVKTTKGGKTVMDTDLDALFATLKTKKVEAKAAVAEAGVKRQTEAARAVQTAEAIKQLEAVGMKNNRLKGSDSPTPLRFDGDLGVPVYGVDQLKIGKGRGDTALCPFDCDCCF